MDALVEKDKISDAPQWLVDLIEQKSRLMSSTHKSVADQVWFEVNKRKDAHVAALEEENTLLRRQIGSLNTLPPGIIMVPQGQKLEPFETGTLWCSGIEDHVDSLHETVIEEYASEHAMSETEGIVGPHEGLGAQYIQKGCCISDGCEPDDN